MADFSDFVGIPFRDKGRGIDGCDCWGLVRLVYHGLCAIDLPSHADRYVTAADAGEIGRLIAGEAGAWRPVPPGSERALDIVLMRERRIARHIGVVTRPGRLLHVHSGIASAIESYRSVGLAGRVQGFHRHESLA